MHIVNYKDDCGFVVVSATTNYVPILAYSDKGHLAVEEDSAVSFYLNEIGEDVNYYKFLPADSVVQYRQLWKKYETKSRPDYPITKSGDITSLVNSYMNQWYAAGYEYYSLSNAQAYIPSNVYSSFVSTAEREANPDFDYMDYSFVTIEYSNLSSTIYGPLIGSSWGYYYPYSNSTTDTLGCGTVAIGQIMYYYNYPNGDWDWDNMYDNTGTSDTRALMYYIKNHISPFGGDNSATTYNAFFLSTTGYSVDLITHNNSRVASSIINGKPVYMSGLKANDISHGHAWVCEGYQDSGNTYITYTLWVIDIDPYPTYDYIDIASDSYSTNPPDFYYLNWGWFGNHDGWFLQDDFRPYTGGPNYSTLRLDIVDIVPNI